MIDSPLPSRSLARTHHASSVATWSTIASLAAQAPCGATLVVFHPAVLVYVTASRRRDFAAAVGNLDAVWLCHEYPCVLPELSGLPSPSPHPDSFVLARDARRPRAAGDELGNRAGVRPARPAPVPAHRHRPRLRHLDRSRFAAHPHSGYPDVASYLLSDVVGGESSPTSCSAPLSCPPSRYSAQQWATACTGSSPEAPVRPLLHP